MPAMPGSDAVRNWKVVVCLAATTKRESAQAILPVKKRMWSKGKLNQGGVSRILKVGGQERRHSVLRSEQGESANQLPVRHLQLSYRQ